MAGFERWTERARTVVALAQECAHKMNHGYIGTEHLLYGLAAEEAGVAARVLADFKVTASGVRERIEHIVGIGPDATSGQLPLTERAKKVQEGALREALAAGHNYIGTEHILLAIVRVNEGVGARILEDWKIDSEKVRQGVFKSLHGPRAKPDGHLDYTIELKKGKPGEGGYTARLWVGEDEFASAHAATRDLALEGIVPYILSTEGFPTDSLDDPIEGLDLRSRILARKGLAA